VAGNSERPRVKVFWAWYDGWVGYFWESKKRCLYVCPIPWLVFRAHRHRWRTEFSGALRTCVDCHEEQEDFGFGWESIS
jgi:hypothetical protein